MAIEELNTWLSPICMTLDYELKGVVTCHFLGEAGGVIKIPASHEVGSLLCCFE